ncbi:MAG: TonB-dependent receptor [Niveispirillum sp.]|uniref:TonB-dependent receptor n=1 Tax=Niveispirillum sp. TaxID=1917217 RepID=UPI003BA744DE
MKTRLMGTVASLSIAMLPTSIALAQTASPVAEEKAFEGLEEIVVTAQRRSENLQNVAIAATALSGEALLERGVDQIADLQFASPSLSITDSGLTQSVNIRGIGIASGSPSVANGVATYIDGVFQPPILTTSSFYDIQNVEVLRGPQGTLVGSNSTGGAIFINTKSPEIGAVEGFAQAGYGNYDEISGQGAVNVPLTETMALRVAGNYRKRDSYYDDVGTFDNNPDRLNEKAGRVGLLWEPGSFRAVAKAELIDRQTGGYAYRPVEGSPFAANRRTDIRELTYNAPTKNHERALLSSLALQQEFDNGIILRSVSGYTNKRVNNLYDLDGGTVATTGLSATQTQDQAVRERQWSQEINVISPTDGDFDWIVGGYYQRNKIDVDIQNKDGSPLDPTDITQNPKKTTTGVFVQGNYQLTPEFELQTGVRYSHFSSSQVGSVIIGAGGPIFGPSGLQVADLSGSHKDGRVTGKVALNWQADDATMVYAFAARGYKPGGSNSATSEFGPETVWDYEAGVKTTLLDGHLRTQAGLFYMTYQGFQFDARNAATGINGVFNLADANIKGVELQAQTRFGGFSLDGSVAYVDSELDKLTIVNNRTLPALVQYGPQCPTGTASNPPICFNYTPFLTEAGGGPNLLSPKWSYNVGIDYALDVGADLVLTPRLNYAYVGSRWTNILYTSRDYLKGFGLVSAQVSLDAGQWTLEAYGNNLTNKKYVSGQNDNNEFYGAPRTYGVRATVRF